MGIPRSLARLALSLGIVSLAVAPRASVAWSAPAQVAMATYALKVIPPDLERQIRRHERRFQEGIRAVHQSRPQVGSTDSGAPENQIAGLTRQQADNTVRFITEHRPFSDIVFQLGVVAHLVAMANDPVPAWKPAQPRPEFKDDYIRYLDTARPRFAVLYYGYGRQIETADQLAELLERAQRRNRLLAPMIAEEYQRIGSVDGTNQFDDKSTAFGVGALAFSHGVSDITAVLRYIWLRAGGADTRHLPQPDENHLILVGRGTRSPGTGADFP